MTAIFSTISGHFGKSLIFGGVLPSLIFIVLWLMVVEPLFPQGTSLLEKFEIFDLPWRIFAAIFITLVLTGILRSLNVPIIRFYEGYPWKNSWIGKHRIANYIKDFEAIQARYKGMRTLLIALDREDEQYTKEFAEINREWSRIGRIINTDYPAKKTSILPTRLGNVIRSFESYPYTQYNIAMITFWPRLVSTIEKSYGEAIDDARTSFDFMINSSFLSGVMALAILLIGFIYPSQLLSSFDLTIIWVLKISIFLLMSYMFYLGSISRASSWGNLIKGAFDLYRWDLLKKMGYQKLPETRKGERQLWYEISQQIIFGDKPLTGPRIDYTDPILQTPPTIVNGTPTDIKIGITRGVIPVDKRNEVIVVIRVKNCDPRRDVGEVVLTDELPKGYDYLWNSASLSKGILTMEGINPYRFLVGDIEPNGEVILRYRIIPRNSDDR